MQTSIRLLTLDIVFFPHSSEILSMWIFHIRDNSLESRERHTFKMRMLTILKSVYLHHFVQSSHIFAHTKIQIHQIAHGICRLTRIVLLKLQFYLLIQKFAVFSSSVFVLIARVLHAHNKRIIKKKKTFYYEQTHICLFMHMSERKRANGKENASFFHVIECMFAMVFFFFFSSLVAKSMVVCS